MTTELNGIRIRCAHTRMVPIEDLKKRFHPRNRNTHPADQIDWFMKVFEHQGIRDAAVLSNLTGNLVTSHARITAADTMGLTHYPVDDQDFDDEEQEYQHLIADNAAAQQSILDFKGINEDLKDLGPFDVSFLGIKDFDPIPEDKYADKYADKDAHEVPELQKDSKVKTGDLWILGNHRLLCGDSTLKQDVERLMAGDMADTCFTSPPYNLGENSRLRGYNGDGDDSAYLTKSDHKTSDEYLEFLNKFTAISLSVSDTAFINIQLLAGNKFVLPKFWNEWSDHLIDLMVWDKEHAAPQMAARVLNSVFELIFILDKSKHPTRSMKHGPDFRGDIQNIFRLNPLRGKKDESKKDHGAVFPVEFAEFFIKRFTDGLIYEPFCGSGSTLIACEKTNRKCFGMEIDPHYCQVIIERWEKFTNLKATREDGKTLDDIAA